MKPLSGHVLVKLPPKKEKIGELILSDADTGTESTYDQEVARVRKEVLNSKAAKFYAKHNNRKRIQELVDRETSKVKKDSPNPSYGADRYNTVCGEVVATPLKMPRKNKKEWACEVKEGDKVYFDYLTIPNAKDRGCIFDDTALVPYDMIHFVIRDGEFIMLNDNVLITPIFISESRRGNLITGQNEYDKWRGYVAHAPKESGLQKGDLVMWSENSDIPLEYELNQTLPEKFYRINLRDVLAKIEINGL